MPGQCLPCCTEGPGLHPAEHRHMGPSARWPWGLGQPWAPGHADKAPAVVFKLVVTLLLVVQEVKVPTSASILARSCMSSF